MRPKLPRVRSIREAEYEAAAVAEYVQWYGSVVLNETVAVLETEPNETNLLEQLAQANAGDAEALRYVDIKCCQSD